MPCIFTVLLFNAIAIAGACWIGNWDGIAYVNLIEHCGAINEEQTLKH